MDYLKDYIKAAYRKVRKLEGFDCKKHTRYSIILTPTGNFKKVYGAFRERLAGDLIKPGITVPRQSLQLLL